MINKPSGAISQRVRDVAKTESSFVRRASVDIYGSPLPSARGSVLCLFHASWSVRDSSVDQCRERSSVGGDLISNSSLFAITCGTKGRDTVRFTAPACSGSLPVRG